MPPDNARAAGAAVRGASDRGQPLPGAAETPGGRADGDAAAPAGTQQDAERLRGGLDREGTDRAAGGDGQALVGGSARLCRGQRPGMQVEVTCVVVVAVPLPPPP